MLASSSDRSWLGRAVRLLSLVALTLWLVLVSVTAAYAYDAHQLDLGSVQTNASKSALEQTDRGAPRLKDSTTHGYDDRSQLARASRAWATIDWPHKRHGR